MRVRRGRDSLVQRSQRPARRRRDEEELPLPTGRWGPQDRRRVPDAVLAQNAAHLQRTVGNAAVEQLVKAREKGGDHKPLEMDLEEIEVKTRDKSRGAPVQRTAAASPPSGARRVVQRDLTAALAGAVKYSPGVVAPKFVLDKPAPKRSNSDASTTKPKAPQMTGHAAMDGASWRFQVDEILSEGTIQIVWYTEDHYPAPTPTNDTGALTNVNEVNWKTIVKDLTDNREGIADFWCAYRAEEVHENYHWLNEWQKTIKPKFAAAQTDIAKLSHPAGAGPGQASTQNAANAELQPKALKIFKDKVKEGTDAFWALGDSPGDPPYVAQAPAIDAVRNRVRDHAAKNGWK